MPDDGEYWRSPQGQAAAAEYQALYKASEDARKEVEVIKRKPGALWVEVRDAERKAKRLQVRYDRRIERDFTP